MSIFQTDPVFQAVSKASVSELNSAIVEGHKINVSDESGITCLDYAIMTLKYSMVNPILVFVNLLLPSEKTAMLNQSLKVLIKAIDKYNSSNSTDFSEEYTIFDSLKTAGANLSIILDEQNNTLYHYAIKMNSQFLFDALYNSNVDSNVCNIQGYDALLQAFMYNRDTYIPSLISKSTNLMITQPYNNKNLLMLAVEQNNFNIVQLLTESVGAENVEAFVNNTDNNKKCALHYVVERYNKTEAATYINYLVSKNANFNIQDIMGNTPLHYACMKLSNHNGSECHCMIKKLVENNASLYIRNYSGIMPIEMVGMDKNLISQLC